MDEFGLIARIEDRITFGAGFIYFVALLVSVFLAFVFGLIRFQNVRAPYGPLSPFIYAVFTILSLFIAYLLLRRIGMWTFSPMLHRRQSVLITVSIYFGIALTAVFLGYLIINPHPSAVGRLGLSDTLVGVTVASVYTAILSATLLLQDPVEILGKPTQRRRCIRDWLEAYEQAVETGGYDNSHTKTYREFSEKSALLLDQLEDAKTNEGEQLRSEFEKWYSKFQQYDSTVRRQAIVTGETDNDNLTQQHQTLTWIRQQIGDIGGDEVGTI